MDIPSPHSNDSGVLASMAWFRDRLDDVFTSPEALEEMPDDVLAELIEDERAKVVALHKRVNDFLGLGLADSQDSEVNHGSSDQLHSPIEDALIDPDLLDELPSDLVEREVDAKSVEKLKDHVQNLQEKNKQIAGARSDRPPISHRRKNQPISWVYRIAATLLIAVIIPYLFVLSGNEDPDLWRLTALDSQTETIENLEQRATAVTKSGDDSLYINLYEAATLIEESHNKQWLGIRRFNTSKSQRAINKLERANELYTMEWSQSVLTTEQAHAVDFMNLLWAKAALIQEDKEEAIRRVQAITIQSESPYKAEANWIEEALRTN